MSCAVSCCVSRTGRAPLPRISALRSLAFKPALPRSLFEIAVGCAPLELALDVLLDDLPADFARLTSDAPSLSPTFSGAAPSSTPAGFALRRRSHHWTRLPAPARSARPTLACRGRI